jgi:hypothetical protein
MNGPARADIVTFIEREWRHRLTPLEQADVLAALRFDGDDALAFMDRFAAEFRVDLTGYERAFHHLDAAGLLRPGWPLPVRHPFGVRLPIAVSTLVRAAQTGRWPVQYPLLPPASQRTWLNAPLILIGLPLAAIAVLGLVRLF